MKFKIIPDERYFVEMRSMDCFIVSFTIVVGSSMVAMAEEKQGIWMFIFPVRENTGNLSKYFRNIFTKGINLQHRDNFEVKN